MINKDYYNIAKSRLYRELEMGNFYTDYKNAQIDREEDRAILEILNNILFKKPLKDRLKMIERIEEKHQYIRYNWINKKLEYYNDKDGLI